MKCYHHLVRNPLPHRVPDEKMRRVLTAVLGIRAMHIGSMLEHGNINDPSFGWCVMDPTSPISRDSEMSILALAWVGPQGMLRLDNAIAKAFALRDHAVLDWELWDPDGVDMMFCADGEFRWPGAVNVNGLIVGGSGFSVEQDIEQNLEFASNFISAVKYAMLEWADKHPLRGEPHWSWFCDKNQPDDRYRASRYLGFDVDATVMENTDYFEM